MIHTDGKPTIANARRGAEPASITTDEWGEAAWTSRDLTITYLVTDALGTIHGRFYTEDEAHDCRARINEMGADCWVIEVDSLEVE